MSVHTPDPWVEERERVARLGAMLQAFQRADRTLAAMEVLTAMTDQPHQNAPAWSDGKNITFNLPFVGSVKSTDDLIKVTGLNYHELAHIMYTPREGSWIVNQVRRAGAWHAFNVLEDQRIETFMTARFLATKPYFVMTILAYCLTDKSQWPMQHVLTYGRRYLPLAVREEMRRLFKEPKKLPKLEALIDEYRGLAYPTDEQRALDVIVEFDRLLKGMQSHVPNDPFGHATNSRPTFGEQEPYDGDEQDNTRQWVEYRDDEDAEDEDADGAGPGEGEDEGDEETEGDGGGSADDADGDLDADDSADADVDADGEGDEATGSDSDGDGGKGHGEGEGEQEGEGRDGSHRSVGKGKSKMPEPGDNLEDLMNDGLDAARNNPEVQQDAIAKKRTIERSVGKLPQLPVKNFNVDDVDPDYMAAQKRFRKELMRVWADSDPGWEVEQPAGKLNINRAVRGQDLDTLFDTWNPGKVAATSIDMVIFVDYSISMRNQMRKVSQCLWAVKRAVEAIGGEVTVLGYNDDATVMYTRRDKASKTVFRDFTAEGYTEPRKAIAEATVMLKHSVAHHRIALFLTDGAWGDADVCNDMIDYLNNMGVITALGYLFEQSYHADHLKQMDPADLRDSLFHHCKATAAFGDANGLVELAKAVVKEAMKSR